MTQFRIKVACFDLDGTLVDTGPPHREAERAALLVLGFEELAVDHPVTFGRGVMAGAQLIAAHYGIVSADEVLAEYLRQWKRLAQDGIDLLPGADAVVRAVAGPGTVVALVTSGERGYTDEFLRVSNLADVFSCTVASEDVANHKPHPEPYLKAAESMGFAASECVVFEDSAAGFRVARAAGMYCVGVGEVALVAAGDHAPDLAIASFEELDVAQLLGTG